MLGAVGRVLWRHLVDQHVECEDDEDEEETEEEKALGPCVADSHLVHLGTTMTRR